MTAAVAVTIPHAGCDSDSHVLKVEHLTTWFPTARGWLHAVDGVSFTLQRGRTLGVVGESGSGKSMLARSVMGLVPRSAVTTGSVQLEGTELRTIGPARLRRLWGREISMVFQDPSAALNPVMRIGDQIAESLRVHLGLGQREARTRSLALLRKVGIPEPELRLRSYAHELSGGMRQRAWIAIAIACSPKVLFADEPTTALDVTIQRQVLDLLAELQRDSGMAIVLISHDVRVVARRADETVVMYAGQAVEIGPTASVFAAPRHPYTVALLSATPRLQDESHTRLATIPGQPVHVVDPAAGCRFAPRCRYARPRCLAEDPPLVAVAGTTTLVRCFSPVGSTAAVEALIENEREGRSPAGLAVSRSPVAE